MAYKQDVTVSWRLQLVCRHILRPSLSQVTKRQGKDPVIQNCSWGFKDRPPRGPARLLYVVAAGHRAGRSVEGAEGARDPGLCAGLPCTRTLAPLLPENASGALRGRPLQGAKPQTGAPETSTRGPACAITDRKTNLPLWALIFSHRQENGKTTRTLRPILALRVCDYGRNYLSPKVVLPTKIPQG